MKGPLLFCCLALATLLAHGQTTNPLNKTNKLGDTSTETDPVARLAELEETMNNPFTQNLVPPRIANKIIYQNQVTIGGVAIQQGRILGANATSDDKGLAVNVGFPPIGTGRGRTVFQLNGLATSEDGFVSVFSGGKYQRTLGGGASALIFLGGGPRVYTERVKKDLQWKYQQMRQADITAWGGRTPIAGKKWRDQYDTTAKAFIEAWQGLQTHNSLDWARRYYLNQLCDIERKNLTDQTYFRSYLALERQAGYLLAHDWDELDQNEERDWLRDSLTTANAGYAIHRDRVARRTLAKSIRGYDSLLVAAPWVRQDYFWLNVGIIGNTMQKPVFDPTASAANMKADRRDNFVIAQIGLNYLLVGQKNNFYFSGSIGISNRRAYDPANLKTYQATRQRLGNDSIRVVDQQQLYPTEPGKEAIFGYLAQATWYHHKAVKYGIEISAGKNLTTLTPKFNATVGFFFPVQTGETTLLLMPLVRWIEPGPVALGVSLTASIPAFVKGK
jgi:hypothetical protein